MLSKHSSLPTTSVGRRLRDPVNLGVSGVWCTLTEDMVLVTPELCRQHPELNSPDPAARQRVLQFHFPELRPAPAPKAAPTSTRVLRSASQPAPALFMLRSVPLSTLNSPQPKTHSKGLATSIEKIAREAHLNPRLNTTEVFSPGSDLTLSDIKAPSSEPNYQENEVTKTPPDPSHLVIDVQAMLKSQIEDRRLEELY